MLALDIFSFNTQLPAAQNDFFISTRYVGAFRDQARELLAHRRHDGRMRVAEQRRADGCLERCGL